MRSEPVIVVDIETLAQGIMNGQRRALARGLTLVESTLPEHEELSLQLFSLLPKASRGYRLGVTGPPGAGKSTLTEEIVTRWLELDQKVAVLTIDPSSRRTGGSLLGDKTRMGRISTHPDVFIRPSPTGEWLGGLGRRTPLACALFERAGYRRIVVETVGVGQSEIGASYLVDCLLLVALPGAGDDVQGIKRGLMEEVDLIAVNKADLGQTGPSVAQLRSALRVFRREVPVLAVSALTGQGLPELMSRLDRGRGENRPSIEECEAYFLRQYSLDFLTRHLEQDSPGWRSVESKVREGRCDFLAALPELTRVLGEMFE